MSFILSCLTDSPSARRVLRATALCARALRRPVRLVHFGTLEEEGRARLGALIAEELSPGEQFEVVQPTGRVGDGIVQLARDLQAGLIIMGAVSREKAVRDLVGSTARRVAWRAPCSVMLVSTIGADPLKWSRLVIGVEATPHGRELAANMVAMARGAAPQAEICFALEYRGIGRHAAPPTEFRTTVDAADLAAVEQHQLASFLEDIETQGIAVSAVALAGRPGQEVARYAEDTQADVLGVVVPARPLGFFDRLMSHPIILLLDKLPCSVLLHRPARSGRK